MRHVITTLLVAASVAVAAPAGARPIDPDRHGPAIPRAAAAPVARRPAVPVTVMSFNACGGVCRHGETDRTAAGIVRSAVAGRASVILLQELCHRQFVRVRDRLPGWSGRFAAQTRTRRCGSDRRFGVAVLTRGTMSAGTVRFLPGVAGAERRVLLGATATVAGRRTYVAVVHLSPRAGRARQLAAVAASLRPRAGMPVIVGGDFNSTPDDPGMRPFSAAMFELDRTNAPTFDPYPRKIDYVFVSDGWFRRSRARTLPTPLSDHRVYLGTTYLAGG